VKVVAGWVAAMLAVIGLAVGILAVIRVGQKAHVAIRPVSQHETPAPSLTPLVVGAPREVAEPHIPVQADRTPALLALKAPKLVVPSDAYNPTLENMVAAGSSRTVTFRVPAGKVYSLDSIVLGTVGSGRGVALVQMLMPGAQVQTLVIEDLARLNEQPATDIRLETPVVFVGGDSVALKVMCQGHETCDVGLLVTGFLVGVRG
jgi:hypothetical protein